MKVAININFDTLTDCLNLVGGRPLKATADPCFGPVMERFQMLSEKFGAPLSLFVVARDLDNPSHREAVKKWAAMGHEIANHSNTHRIDFALLKKDDLKQEVEESHHKLCDLLGQSPHGFIAPTWASSQPLSEVLSDFNYSYDCSLAPSWNLLLASLVLWSKSKQARKCAPVIRKDWFANLFGKTQPYIVSKQHYLKTSHSGTTIMLPLPSAYRFGIWHTLAHRLPDSVFDFLLEKAATKSKAFYYLMHPVDLLDFENDVLVNEDRYSLQNIERINIPISEKLRRVERSLEVLKSLGANFVTMSELASDARARLE